MPNKFEKTDSRRPGKPFKPASDDNGVAEATGAFHKLHCKLKLIHTLLGGTDAMIAAGRTLLPQHDYESDGHYKARLQGTVLDNFVETTLSTWVGKAFSESPRPSVTDAPPDRILEFLEDVDGAGTGFVQFAKSWFRSGLRDGEAYALIDFTAGGSDPEDPKAGTRAADAGARSVWRIIEAGDMLEYREGPLGPRTVCTLLRFRCDQMVPLEPWGEQLEERVKIIRPGSWELWAKRKDATKKEKWVRIDGGAYDPDEVRVVPFRVEDLPLAGLAHLNRRHWESSSDQNNILRVTRFPILAASGVRGEAADTIVVGPNKFITTPDPQSKVYYVENTGAAVEQGYKDLERLEDRMASYGAEFMKRDAQGPASATEASNDASEAVSPLRGWVLSFKDCLERALQLTGQWERLGDDNAGSIDFDMDDGPEPAEGAHLQALKDARASRDLSRENYLDGLKRRGVLPEEFNFDDNEAQLGDEPPPAGGGLGGMAAGLNGGARPVAPGATRQAPPPTE